jgi:hypothetical protein
MLLRRVRWEALEMWPRRVAVESRVVPEWFPRLGVEVVAAGFAHPPET